ncbi:uncharacterized protein LOC100836726 [Brachypodium distachyon]|uniref:F-box domain-containing protein n=1 Tax=Brachypodium distachyon TaxID=15368 RepID=A0A0Q3HEX2_BRADI|nr:uncharacterized protein LOC100836726 [Brachypodium distachyon]KQK21077.1 hypothetical protein BRADI_1g58592v3 [Brachypodium distachyon]|eukprot:XP_003561468.3 uncharacterized protein LOC100836726 [Brachypodium distachyon]
MALPDELFEEILLRLPPDEPACLLRASAVCKPWRRRLSDPKHLRLLHARHGRPPLLGFLHNLFESRIPCFVPTTASGSFPLAVPDQLDWSVIDCRHGRALLFAQGHLLVWDPITGSQRRVPAPAQFKGGYANGAVVCAADGGRRGGPFRVVFVFHHTLQGGSVMSACVYSSEETGGGAWTEPASLDRPHACYPTTKPSVLVGNSRVYFLCGEQHTFTLEYDLERRSLAKVDLPPPDTTAAWTSAVLMPTENNRLGVAAVVESSLHLWSRDVGANGDAGWVLTGVMDIHNLLPIAAFLASWTVKVIGFAEEANTVFLCTFAGVFTIELESDRVGKVYATKTGELSFAQVGSCYESLFPFSSFYIPGALTTGKQVAAPGGGGGTLYVIGPNLLQEVNSSSLTEN